MTIYETANLTQGETAPFKTLDFFKDPRTATLLIGTAACVADSYLFYADETAEWCQYAWDSVPLPTGQQVRLSTYVYTIDVIVGYAFRAEGRFINTQLRTDFYGE